MISYIASLLPLLLILIVYIQSRRCGGLKHLISRLNMKRDGYICYSCSTFNPSEITNENKVWRCKSCFRNLRIYQINSRPKFYFDLLGEYLVRKNFNKIQDITIVVGISLFLTQIILHFFDIIINLSIISNLLFSILWCFLIFRNWIVLK
jgi:DNA-directed RNA polymerase subunit RPC12/RpoP